MNQMNTTLTTTFFWMVYTSIPLAVRCKTWVCGHLLAGVKGSNPAGMSVCCECCMFSGRGLLSRADHSSRRFLPSVDNNNSNNNNNNIYLLQLGCYPVAVVILHANKHEIGYY